MMRLVPRLINPTSYNIQRRQYNNALLLLVTGRRFTTAVIVISSLVCSLTTSSSALSSSTSASASSAARSTKLSTSTTTITTGSSNRIYDLIMADLPLDTLAEHANSYASANGIMVRVKDSSSTGSGASTAAETAGSGFACAPMSLLPNAYPRALFRQARDVAPYFNELVDRVSRDASFLQSTLGGGVSTMDPYTAHILKLYQQVYVDGEDDEVSPAKQADRLGIHRSDYMLHKDDDDGDGEYELKQVELNTIAASFAGLSCKIAKLHTYLTSRFQTDVKDFLQINQRAVVVPRQQDRQPDQDADDALGVPENPALTEIPNAMRLAVDRYVDRYSPDQSHRVVVLFVVQEGETNTVDQRLLEFALWENHCIPAVRLSLGQAEKMVTVNDQGALLLLKQDDDTVMEVAVVYYRAGYAPTDYPGGDDGVEWKARLTLEQSRAAKCPSLGYHLAGTKKVQQELARPGVLERFFPAESEKPKVEAMRACFAGLYSMGDDATDQDLAAARAVLDGKEASYVLKPQREGGGYNFYGSDLAQKLRDNTSLDESTNKLKLGDSLAEFILMQRLFPPQQRAILLRGGKVEGSGDSVSELGCFGCLLVDPNGKILHNKYSGFLLRTKFSGVDEGGVASGFATLSSPYLC